MKRDPRIDAYIERAAPFARPILGHIRDVVGTACPDGEEAIKWGMPAFLHRGRILANMGAFKAHATLNFWQGERVTGDDAKARPGDAMGQFGRLAATEDLPDPAALAAMVRKAMALIDDDGKPPRPLKHPKPPAEPPEDLAAALARSAAAKATFDGFPPGQRREYVDWITGAKRADTRRKRLETTIAQLEEGKRLNWKYERC